MKKGDTEMKDNNLISRTNFEIPVVALRKMPDPVDEETFSRYFAVVKVSDLPFDLPKETNPRKQNLKTAVAKKIEQSLIGHETGQLFHLLNRGLLISAHSVTFDNKVTPPIMTLRLPNQEKHGLVDGGHTYEIIKKNIENMPYDQYVTLEIMTGIEDDFEVIAGARNTSVQVKDKSLAELEGKLDVIHNLVKGLPFEHDINYVEFDEHHIDVLDVIAILTIFHNDIHHDSNPVYCYSYKSIALKNYLTHIDTYKKFHKVVKDIFALHDHIKKTMKQNYSGDLGRLKEIGYKDGKAEFALQYSKRDENDEFQKIKYDIPSGFVYPILGSIRFLIEDTNSGVYGWKFDPLKFYDKYVAKQLVDLTMEASRELGRNPMAVGKSPRHWNGLYNQVATTFYQMKE
jgi:hypothetical protein